MSSLTASKFAGGLAEVPEVKRLSARVLHVLGLNPGPMTLTGTNTYLVGTGERRLLIDTGEGLPEYTAALAQQLRENSCHVERILLTHRHHDHVGGVASLLEEFADLPPRVHKFATPGSSAEEVAEELGIKGSAVTVEPIADGDTFEVEGATLQAIHTPGHTGDHVAFLLQEERSVFTGDCVLGAGTAVFQNLGDYMQSLAKLAQVKPSRVYPGHGPVVEDGNARVLEYIEHRRAREAQVLEVLSGAGRDASSATMSAQDIAKSMYSAEGVPEHLLLAAAGVTLLHLIKLEEDEMVVRADAPSTGGAGGDVASAPPMSAEADEAAQRLRALGVDLDTKWCLATSRL